MIQDISPKKLHNEYRPDAVPAPGDRFVFLDGDRLCVNIDADRAMVSLPAAEEIRCDRETPVYLFSVDGISYFTVPDAGPETFPEGYGRHGMRDLFFTQLEPKSDVFALFTGYHLIEWYRASRFCGRCGARTEHAATERAMVCPACGGKVYPRLNPAVIVGVLNGDRLLVTRYREGRAPNALIAGFTEIGETVEETVRREVMEEVGLRVKNIRYYKSQPWGMAQDILMGFYCEVDGPDEIHRDDSELKYAGWVTPDELVLQPADYSLTNEMMKLFRDGAVPGVPGSAGE